MGTPAVVRFNEDKDVTARIYRHWDGYPDTMLDDLQKFFKDVENQTNDTRFNDPAYLAAKYVVWQANEYCRTGKPLDFLSVGVVSEAYEDGYIYEVNCDSFDDNGRPKITYE